MTSHPRNGYLEVDPPVQNNNNNDDDQDNVVFSSAGDLLSFDQQTIDQGRLHYIQSISNQSSDSFTMDVTNGITSMSGLVFRLTVLPTTIYIETKEMAVTEGG